MSVDVIATDEQRRIADLAARTKESIIVEALAGSGKTWMLTEILKVLRQPTALVLAFNKRIADEMARKKPTLPRTRIAHVRTLHSAGLWILKHSYPSLTVDRHESERLVAEASPKKTLMRVRWAAIKLMRLAKDLQHSEVLDASVAFRLGIDFGAFDKLEGGHEIEAATEITQKAYTASLDVHAREHIDFSDMGWLPLVLNLQPPHRYQALMVDEAQDVNENQLEMIDRIVAPGGRVIACGDRYQSIYGWRGATPEETWSVLGQRYKPHSMPLTMTWRCDRQIVTAACDLVPSLRARPGAGEGVVENISSNEFLSNIENTETDTFVLSRTNAELLRVAFEMWKRQVPFNTTMESDDNETIGPLYKIVEKLLKQGEPSFARNVASWYMTEKMKAEQSGSPTFTQRIDDQHTMLQHCMRYVPRPSEILRALDAIFSFDNGCWITLSTVHKAKGLEASHVYLLRETFARYQKKPAPESEIPQEELNIEYVAITRAKHRLVWVHG